jgi:WD40 repeat protein
MPDVSISAPLDSWTAAIHRSRDDRQPIGAGVVIDEKRVLTCAHVVRYEQQWRDEVWVAFPKAPVPGRERRQVARYATHYDTDRVDLVVLELAEPVPAQVTPARIRCLPPATLGGLDWWAFGFPGRQEAGDEARGTVGPPLAYGLVRLDTNSQRQLEPGFSGSGVWLPQYEAVVGLVVAAAAGPPHHGNGHALTIHQADRELPELSLSTLSEWSAEAADEPALAAWGWALRTDPEAGRHWLPRGRGVAVTDEGGYRFRGRTEALTEVVQWLDRATPDRRVLVVTGSPGVGKSAVLGRVVTTADPELRGQLPTEDQAVRASEGSVACAVHAKGKTALDVAREIARAASVALPEVAEDLVPALQRRLAERPRRFNLVVDALDEAASPEEARQLVRTVLLPLAASAPNLAVQVVVGTRRTDDEGDLLGAFSGRTSVIDLDDPDYFAEPDLVAYVTATLQLLDAERNGNPYADPAVAVPVAERIATLAGRNFLVAGLVAGAHGRYDTEPVDLDKVSFTPTVDAALDTYLSGLPPLGNTPARLALAVLAYAEPPGLPLPLWQAGIGALGGTATEDQIATFARSSAANFLVETNTGPAVRAYRLFHQALGEALLRSQDAVGSRTDDERRLFDAWLAHGRRTGWSAAYDYLLRGLPAHARRAGRLDELLADDRYLLHADLRRLLQVADGVATTAGKARVRLLQRTPLAVGAGPAERAAMFSVTEQLDQLGSRFAATAIAPYSGRWARTPPRHELAALEGHATGVLAVCPVPLAGRSLLASAGQDGTVRLWDPTTGQPERVLTGHTDWVRGICAIQTGERHLLATASDDHTVRLWDPATGQPERVLTGHTDWVRGICAIQTGERHLLATASDDHTVRLWDPATGQPERVLGGHPGWVTAVCQITVGGRRLLATAGYDTMIRLWDPATGQLARALDGRTGWVTSLCAVDVDGRELLATAGYDSTVCLWDPATGRRGRSLTGHTRPVTGLCTVAGLLAATSEDGTVRLWNPATGDPVKVLEGHTDWIRAACEILVGGRRLLVSAGDDGTVRLWDPGTGQPERVIDGTGPVVGLCTVAGLLASTGRDGTVRLWEPRTGEPRASLTGHTAAVTSVCAVSVAERPLLASASEDRTIRLWDPGTGRPHRALVSDQPAVTAVCAVPLESHHLLASASDTLRLWDPATAQIDRVLGHMRWVTAVCTVPIESRQLLASSDEDGVVRLWDPSTGTLERELRCHHAATTALCAVPVDGRHLLASASDDHTVLLWEPESGSRVWALHGHTGPVTGLCAVPAGKRHLLASTSADRTVRLWDPATGTVQLTIPIYHRALTCWYTSGTLVIGLDTGMLAIELRGQHVSGRR